MTFKSETLEVFAFLIFNSRSGETPSATQMRKGEVKVFLTQYAGVYLGFYVLGKS